MSSPARPLADPRVRRVAIVRLRVGLGDLLASVPALRALRAARPDVHVTVVTWARMRPVLERQSAYVDELLAFPGWPGIPERPARTEELPGFLAAVRERRFDLAIQAYGALPAANEVTAALGARITGGFFTPGRWDGDLATHLPYPHRRLEVDRHLELMAFLGAAPGPRHLEFPLREADRAAARQLQRRLGLRPGGYAVVHPGATANSRRWPAARFAAVADALAGRGLAVALSGVPGEESLTAAVAGRMRTTAADLCGRTDLGAFAALLADAAVLVGNDSGPAHLAAAVGTPSATVFMAGDPLRWAADDDRRHAAVAADVGCRPCGLLDCPIDLRCAWEISADTVVAAAARVLAGAPTRA